MNKNVEIILKIVLIRCYFFIGNLKPMEIYNQNNGIKPTRNNFENGLKCIREI